MVSQDSTHALAKRKKDGFTLVELMIAIAIIGVLAAISIPNFMIYRLKVEHAVLQENLRVLMDMQDFYFHENDKFYPENGIINVPRGVYKHIHELGYTFAGGHKHRYLIYGLNRDLGRWKYNYYYIIVYCDIDFNRNGREDIFYYITYFRNGEQIYNRRFYQLQ